MSPPAPGSYVPRKARRSGQGLAPLDVPHGPGGALDGPTPASKAPTPVITTMPADVVRGAVLEPAVSGGPTRKRNRGDSDRTPRDNALSKKLKGDGGPSDEAISLGYDTGTIKHAAFVLLSRVGTSGITVAEIVAQATKEGLYSWGTCKTPSNSVTAALSQDTNFVRVAPSTYTLKCQLRAAGQLAASPLGKTVSGVSGGSNRPAAAAGDDAEPPTATSRMAKGEKSRAMFRRTASPASGAWEWLRGSGTAVEGASGVHGTEASTSKAVGSTPPAGSLKVHLEGNLRRCLIDGERSQQADVLLLDPSLCSPEHLPPVDHSQTVEEPRNPVLPNSPTAREAGSCLFRYPHANPPVSRARLPPADTPASPSEGTKRALQWKEEVLASKLKKTAPTSTATATSKPSAAKPKDSSRDSGASHSCLPSWVLEAYRIPASPTTSVQSAAATAAAAVAAV